MEEERSDALEMATQAFEEREAQKKNASSTFSISKEPFSKNIVNQKKISIQ
ncbi:hypothetical protein HYZ97_04830 [Candidatus Pacearchaeota archaeon]|nr:hypothetical protein [Candidatus Pacearchaeota archaeon]